MSATLCNGQFALVSPTTGRPLTADRFHSITDGVERWPVVCGIPYLRVGRDALRAEALAALDAGDESEAAAILLADQDDYARTPPPSREELRRLVTRVDADERSLRTAKSSRNFGPLTVSLCDAMVALNFGPVADYFAFRWSSPTYLSGLALLNRFAPADLPVIEVACGIGHYLRDLEGRRWACLGIDVVFSKLWLARRLAGVWVRAPLLCGDVVRGLPIRRVEGSAVVFCHDAFYFLPDQPDVVAGFRQLAGDGGRILIGHAHNRNSDHGGVAGEPKTPAEYQAILPDARLFDDAELARSAWTGEPAPERTPNELDAVEALGLVVASGDSETVIRPLGPQRLHVPIPGRPLRLNPLLVERDGMLVPDWPSERFRLEYEAASGYLLGEPMPSQETLDRAERGEVDDPEVARLARRRILLDLPERWGTGR